MCLRVDKTFKIREEVREFFNKPLIAKKEIKVHKVLCFENNKYYSPYRGMKYQKGFHYTNNKFTKDIFFCIDRWYLNINAGLHSFVFGKIPPQYSSTSYKVVEMYIPKGAKYFLGTNNEIVSDNLIWY